MNVIKITMDIDTFQQIPDSDTVEIKGKHSKIFQIDTKDIHSFWILNKDTRRTPTSHIEKKGRR